MALTLYESDTELMYTDDDSGTTITVKKDDAVVDVHQVTPVENAGGQTWQDLKTYLDTKVG